ncbi:triose-phosphate isomerase [Roseibium limicola]|uniref:Triosephosphate isomerase n=1 Tax=Roseibium limicola TaxID=2816037 RepID=A0A939ES52_9HYPH|nr:triose-phosphate isomerase [Roseibium limicola]MBO0347310.1 triose-phosphate isomerase [Roseibium limicola]
MASTASSQTIKPIVAGNWKMNGARASLATLAAIGEGVGSQLASKVDVMICPPAPLVFAAATACEKLPMTIGAQDCHAEESGAHTGDTSAEMLADCGAVAVIVGHSERRADHGERDADVKAKAEAAYRAGLVAIVCVGETRAQREAGEEIAVVSDQLAESLPDAATAANTIVAYEPVWAIGTGLTPTANDVAAMHKVMRDRLTARFGNEGASMRLLYGGSVKPGNAAELMGIDHVNGALVGGASLKAEDFLGIISAYA